MTEWKFKVVATYTGFFTVDAKSSFAAEDLANDLFYYKLTNQEMGYGETIGNGADLKEVFNIEECNYD